MPLIDMSAGIADGMVRHPAPHLPEVSVQPAATHETHKRSVQKVTFGTHVSTHLDAPFHALPDGATIDRIDLEVFIGEARMVMVEGVGRDKPIAPADLEPHADILKGNRRVILRTGWAEQTWGTREYFTQGPYLTREAARFLADCGLWLLGMDFPNIDAPEETRAGIPAPNHQIMLGTGMVLLENLLNLDKIPDAPFRLMAQPLALKGGDGCPCRAVAETG